MTLSPVRKVMALNLLQKKAPALVVQSTIICRKPPIATMRAKVIKAFHSQSMQLDLTPLLFLVFMGREKQHRTVSLLNA